MSKENLERIKQILIEKGKEFFKNPPKKIDFFRYRNRIKKIAEDKEIEEANDVLNNLKKYPHAFVLACVMDRQIKAEKAWLIPYLISKEIGSFEFEKLFSLGQEETKRIFQEKKLHRFNDEMAKNFYETLQKIHKEYNDDASNIWKDNPKSATVVRRFLEFRGMGIKIATMATNILARELRVPMKDYLCIDISPDVQVKRVFERIGFISKDASNDELIYSARELNPEYPGVFDLPCWEIGRKWCRPKDPKCNECYLDKWCEKNKISSNR